jgi:hypothetical protein
LTGFAGLGFEINGARCTEKIEKDQDPDEASA